MLKKFTTSVSAMAGLWGVKREVLDGYVALAKAGASASDLLRYSDKNELGMTLEDATRTVASIRV